MIKAVSHRPRKIADAVTLPAAAVAIGDSPLLYPYPDTVERYRVLNALTPLELDAWAQLRGAMLADYMLRRGEPSAVTPLNR
jgi:hypothetical protein